MQVLLKIHFFILVTSVKSCLFIVLLLAKLSCLEQANKKKANALVIKINFFIW